MFVGGQIELVADQKQGEIRARQGASVVEKRLHAAEGRVRCEVVDEDGAGSAAVV